MYWKGRFIEMDREEFLELALKAEPTLFHISFSLLHNEQDCADAVQEALLKAYDQRGKLRRKEYFQTWLVRIVINECYGILRRRKHFQSCGEVEITDRAHLGQYVREEYMDLYQAIARLEERERVCVLLFYMEGYSVGEIGEILKIPKGTVKSRLSRARDMLRGLLSEQRQ